MSEKIEQLLERQNELLGRVVDAVNKQQEDVDELVKLTYLVIRSQTWPSKLPEKAKKYYNSKIKEYFG